MFKRIAIALEPTDTQPDGLIACLQVLSEFMDGDGEVLIAGNGKFMLRDLLPRAFRMKA